MPALFPTWTWILGFIFGAFVGSFLNMAIYRLPRGLSFVEPSRSFCPKCKHSLGSADLMPILSWLIARGRCRYCREPVSSRYFWVEVLTGSLFGAIWWRYLTDTYDPLRAGAYALMAACLVAVFFIDWELYIIPDELNAAILIVAIVYHAINHSLGIALAGALWGWGLLFGITLLGRIGFGKDAMGDGDIKMMRGVGALLGPWLLIGNLAIAVVAGLIGGIIGIVAENRRNKGKVESGDGKEPEEEDLPAPTPVSFVVLAGAWYLACLDVVSLFVPPLNRWIAAKVPQEVVEDEEDWAPTPTTIPFGPYLAIGALLCMIFAGQIERGLKSYFHVSQADQPVSALPVRGLARLN